MISYVVPGGQYRQLYFESMDPDRYTRRVQPLLSLADSHRLHSAAAH